MDTLIRSLEKRALDIRRDIVEMIGVGKTGHLGGSCSLADIMSVLYFHVMNHSPENPSRVDRDRLILSKGHAAIVQYAALAECGYFDREELKTLKQLHSRLQGHPDMRKLPGIEANTGSLGQGVSIACGLAAGLKADKIPARVYAVVGDGELAEGQLWEAFMSASHYRLDNLCVILDMNGLQATGKITDRFNTGDAGAKFEAFGFRVFQADGHNIGELLQVFEDVREVRRKPSVILARTVKGKGIPFAENVVSFHNGSMTQEQYDEVMEYFGEQEAAL